LKYTNQRNSFRIGSLSGILLRIAGSIIIVQRIIQEYDINSHTDGMIGCVKPIAIKIKCL